MNLKIKLLIKRSSNERESTEVRLDASAESMVHSEDRPRRLRRVVRNIAIAIVSLYSTSGGGFHFGSTTWATYRTQVGESLPLSLEDGSSILLNTDTEIAVRVGPAGRDIRLFRGEAFFNVVHKDNWPFVVSAGRTTTRDVGTAFSLHMTENQAVDLIVSEGRVQVDSADVPGVEQSVPGTEPTMIEAGDIAVIHDREVSVTAHNELAVERKLAWTRGELVWRGESLAQVVQEVNRYNRIQLRVGDPSIAQLPIGGTINPRDLESFINWLCKSQQIVGIDAGKTMQGATIMSLRRVKGSSSCQRDNR